MTYSAHKSPADSDIEAAQAFLEEHGLRHMSGVRNGLVNLLATLRRQHRLRQTQPRRRSRGVPFC